MKQSRPVKKKKKETTWAEAITEVLERSNTKVLGYQEIHEKIILYKLRDIKMTKPDEKILKTMLAQQASYHNCPFYKVKDRPGYYALKERFLRNKPDGAAIDPSDADSPLDVNEDSNESGSSLKRKSRRKAPSPNVIIPDQKNTTSKKKLLTDKVLSNSATQRSNSYTTNALKNAQLLARRRTSSPNVMPSFVHANLRNRRQIPQVHRSRSTNSLQKAQSNLNPNRTRTQPCIDLETPSSVLTNTRLKSIVTSETFTMLPTSYQYQLIQLLPRVDRIIDANGVQRMTQTALNNEFFSQALQDWVTQLSEGEFTRETQARIMQEIAKERSKFSPWKEKFFEEYYGQKKELKRTRSRSHDATLNLTDLSFEAQLVKFQHLCKAAGAIEVKGEEENDNEIISVDSGSESDQDPNYVSHGQQNHDPRPTTKNPSIKPINRRKITKPFKRTIVNSTGDYSQNTSMIHRKQSVQHPTTNPLFNRYGSNAATKFKPGSIMHNNRNFQIRDESYRSDSEASDADESDRNSFHQHDETDDEGESSDGMMNQGDDNLMDVDEDSDSEDLDGPNSDCVSTDHSYTRSLHSKGRRRSSDDREWRRPIQTLASVRPVLSSEDAKPQPPAQNTTLVLRPRGNLGPAVQAIDCSEDSGSTSPEQPYKKLRQDQPMFEKIVTVSKENTTKEERVGVLFGRGLQPTVNSCYGESIVPRISTTSGLLSSPITPTTVCTSTTSARIPQEVSNDRIPPGIVPNTLSELATTLKTEHSFGSGGGTTPQNVKMPAVPRTRSSGTTLDSFKDITQSRATDQQTSATEKIPSLATSREPSRTLPKLPHAGPGAESVCNVATSNSNKAPTQNLGQAAKGAHEDGSTRTSSPILTGPKRNSPTSSPSKSGADESKGSPVLGGLSGNKWPQSAVTSSPVKRTRTLAEIKAQMKAKKLAAVSASPNRGGIKPGSLPQSPVPKPPVKIAKPVFCPTPSRNLPLTSESGPSPGNQISCTPQDEMPPIMGGSLSEISPNSNDAKNLENPSHAGQKDGNTGEKKEIENAESSPKNSGKIILKIKAKEGKNYSVKVDTENPTAGKTSDSEEDVIVRKTRRLSQVISSSGESSDDFDNPKDPKNRENYSMLSQLSLPGSYAAKATVSVMDHHALLKRTQKSPVFGEPAFEGLSTLSKSVSSLPTTSSENMATETKSQPFMSDKPVIGFQDIPSCTALSTSNTPTFIHPSAAITVASEAQKYRSTSKGKSLVQMQQLARTNRIPSDESEVPDSDTEDDSTVSTTSSAEDDVTGSVQDVSIVNTANKPESGKRSTSNKTDRASVKSGKTLENGPHNNGKSSENKEAESDCEDSYSSSSNDERTVITECICACKRLVLCKGCGAYTHEECLSPTRLCSLCV